MGTEYKFLMLSLFLVGMLMGIYTIRFIRWYYMRKNEKTLSVNA